MLTVTPRVATRHVSARKKPTPKSVRQFDSFFSSFSVLLLLLLSLSLAPMHIDHKPLSRKAETEDKITKKLERGGVELGGLQRGTVKSVIYLFYFSQSRLTFSGRGLVLHTEDGVGPRGPVTHKEGKIMFTPLQTAWVRVDP